MMLLDNLKKWIVRSEYTLGLLISTLMFLYLGVTGIPISLLTDTDNVIWSAYRYKDSNFVIAIVVSVYRCLLLIIIALLNIYSLARVHFIHSFLLSSTRPKIVTSIGELYLDEIEIQKIVSYTYVLVSFNDKEYMLWGGILLNEETAKELELLVQNNVEE